jgi:integrase/recombinase XerD
LKTNRKNSATKRQKEVGILDIRKHTKHLQNITFEVGSMTKQAKTLTAEELRRVLDYVATRKHSTRNRALVVASFYSGCRVGELSSLTYSDVVDDVGKVRDEIRLRAENTKTKEARIVFVNAKLKKELQQYANFHKPANTQLKFFYSQKKASDGYNANTLTQFFHYLYRRAGVFGASSHSGRRTFITNLANKGISVRVLASLAGHRNISTTQAYIDVNDDMKRKAVELA